MRRAFTLMELLIVMMILAILVGLALVGLNAAINDARHSRTQAIINKIDGLLAEKWENYRARPVPIRVPSVHDDPADPKFGQPVTAQESAALRLMGLRALQRVELPDRISDLCTNAELNDLAADSDLDAIADPMNARMRVLDFVGKELMFLPSVGRSYKRLAARNIKGAWTTQFQGAECLYLILSTIKDGDKSALDYFSTDEIGDTDGDGMREVLDGWGRPLEFLRWAPGYTIQNLAVTDQTADTRSPDPFDPLHVDGSDTYAIHPLIYSAGQDGEYEINRGTVIYSWPDYPGAAVAQPNDPYYAASPLIGTPAASGWEDNSTNHAKQ